MSSATVAGSPVPDQLARSRAGLAFGLAAFLFWGGPAPLYFHAMASVPALEILAHRVVWSFLILFAMVAWSGRLGETRVILTSPRRWPVYIITTLLISTNWGVFIWATGHNRLLETSLGYYLTPLVLVVLGVLLLGEKLRFAQAGAVVLALGGCSVMVIAAGGLPWVSLTLVTSWSFYALVRKKYGIDPTVGIFIETLIALPLSLGYIGWLHWSGQSHFSGTGIGMLMLAGPVTAIPMVCFMMAAARLRLSTIGILQYLTPTLSFLLAVLVFEETFTPAHAVTFTLIWVGIAIFCWDGVRASSRAVVAAAPAR
ncbi:EamA family transporter RarD [Radicibacter daui]|uniref:EamA family transporter RarD n=1 Tax=Radicibacter daui TaxID=3064829 RepID=UPI004046C5BE